MDGLILTAHQWQNMQVHVEKHAPMEACGLLAGNEAIVGMVQPITNRAQSPVRYVMDPAEQLETFNLIDQGGMELLGIFHSHPLGPEGPSQTDIEEAAYPVVYIVWSHGNGKWEAHGYRIQAARAREVELRIIDEQ